MLLVPNSLCLLHNLDKLEIIDHWQCSAEGTSVMVIYITMSEATDSMGCRPNSSSGSMLAEEKLLLCSKTINSVVFYIHLSQLHLEIGLR